MSTKHYKSITEVAELLKIKKHVIRYWDSRIEGVSTRLSENKRRYFSPQNIERLQSLKKLLHTNDKSHHSLIMARNILDSYNTKKKKNIILNNDQPHEKIDINIDKLVKVSTNLKKLIE